MFLGELVVRFYLHLHREILPAACRREDPVLHHALIHNTTCRFKTSEWNVTFQINSLGMRDREYSFTKPAGTYRILLLGDSFAEGYGVAEASTYQANLEEQLNKKNHRNLEILNAGVQSYSPRLEYLFLTTQGMALQPDMIILSLDLTDFSDQQRYQILTKIKPTAVTTTISDQWERSPILAKPIPSVTWIPFIPTSIKWWLHQHSRLYDLAIFTVKKLLYPDIFKGQIDFTPQDPFTDSFVILRPKNEQQHAKLWEPMKRDIRLIKAIGDKYQLPVIVMMHPHGHQISANEWSEGRKSWDFMPQKIYGVQPQAELQSFLESENIPYVDLLPAFKATERRQKKLFFSLDGHLTAVGHQVIADTLFAFLQQHQYALE